MRRLLLLALLLLCPFVTDAQQNTIVVVSAGGAYSDIRLWMNFEDCGVPPCTAYTIGSDEYTRGDITITFNNGAGLRLVAVLDGSVGLDINAAGPDYAELDVAADDLVNPIEGRIGMKFQYAATTTGNPLIFNARSSDSATRFRLELGAGGTSLRARWDDGTNDTTSGSTSTLSTTTEYCIELTYDATSDTFDILVDSTEEDVTWAGSMLDTGVPNIAVLEFGNSLPSDTGAIYLDTIAISDSATRDLCALFAISEDYPG